MKKRQPRRIGDIEKERAAEAEEEASPTVRTSGKAIVDPSVGEKRKIAKPGRG